MRAVPVPDAPSAPSRLTPEAVVNSHTDEGNRVGDLANAVAALEASAKQARELREVVERLDTEISVRMEEIEQIGSEIWELESNLDDHICEHDFMAVQQAVDTLHGLVNWRTVLPAIDSILLLTAIRDGQPLPDLDLPHTWPGGDAVEDHEHPTLTQADLDREHAADIARAEQQWQEIWGDHEWEDEAERESHRADARYEAEQEAVINRTRRAGRHLMKLFEYVAETVGELPPAAEEARREDAIKALAAVDSAAREAASGYKLYEVNLSEQYTSNPSSLGAMGEFIGGFTSWMMAQKNAKHWVVETDPTRPRGSGLRQGQDHPRASTATELRSGCCDTR
ncbi:hypothetical protein [Streptomyces sp. NPDC048577]|uniref:hypothetical protein n=1 Tax=Streptomyces sp. NPDC048577 TaxID=3157209 RepID=UPI0034352821